MPHLPDVNNLALSVNFHSLSHPGGGVLLSAINFQLAKGECIAVIGPNGSGKTSLLRAICQTLKPDGDICLYGQRISTLNPVRRAQLIAVMAQSDMPDLRLALEDYVALGRIPFAREMSNAAHQVIINTALEETGLLNLRKRSLASLSGGERQRAAMARALAQTPRLLLLDEPTNHLDHPGRAELLSLVKQKGIAVVCVLHDLHFVDAFADRVLILSQGAQIVFDKPERVLTTEFLRPVFGLNAFSVAHPAERGKRLRVFDVSH